MGFDLAIDDPTFLGELLAQQGVAGFETQVPVLPPLVPVPPERLADAVRQAPLYHRLVAFVDWVGDGRGLTTRGNLALADARQLVTLLGTDDPLDHRVGNKVLTTRSSTELPGVDLMLRWAGSSGFVKVRHGRVQQSRRAAQLTGDPLAAWERAFAGLLDLGILQHAYRHARWLVPPWAADLDEAVEALLVLLYAACEPQPIDELAEFAWDVVEQAWELDDLPRDQYERWRRSAARDVRTALARFAELGAVEVLKVGTASAAAELGGSVTLTNLGKKGIHRRAEDAGVVVPVAGALRDASAVELLRELADWPDVAARSEALAWLVDREPVAAAEDVVAALYGAPPSVDELGVAFAMLGEIGDDAVPAVRALAGDEQLGPYAAAWLLERGLAAPSVEPAAVLLAAAATGGPDLAVEALRELPAALQPQVVDDLRRRGGPHAEKVLEAIAATHPDKAVAKAARRARFRPAQRTS